MLDHKNNSRLIIDKIIDHASSVSGRFQEDDYDYYHEELRTHIKPHEMSLVKIKQSDTRNYILNILAPIELPVKWIEEKVESEWNSLESVFDPEQKSLALQSKLKKLGLTVISKNQIIYL